VILLEIYHYNEYMLNFIDMYSFIPVSSCVDVGPCALLYQGFRYAVRTALFETPQDQLQVYVVT
jgi:hypothetical protein